MTSPYSRRDFLTHSMQTLCAMPSFIAPAGLFAADAPSFTHGVSFKHLSTNDQAILVVLLPIALGVKLNPSELEDQKLLTQTMKAFDHIIDHLSERNRQNLLLLLTLLAMPVTRAALGLWTSWEQATQEEVLGFLSRWERSILSLKRFGYQSLMQLMEYAYYGIPAHTRSLKFPGVPSSIKPYLNSLPQGGS